MAGRIKFASNITKKGDIDGYAHLIWSRIKDLSGWSCRLFETFPAYAVYIATILFFLGRRFAGKDG